MLREGNKALLKIHPDYILQFMFAPVGEGRAGDAQPINYAITSYSRYPSHWAKSSFPFCPLWLIITPLHEDQSCSISFFSYYSFVKLKLDQSIIKKDPCLKNRANPELIFVSVFLSLYWDQSSIQVTTRIISHTSTYHALTCKQDPHSSLSRKHLLVQVTLLVPIHSSYQGTLL